MGTEVWSGGFIKCDRCGKKFHNLKNVLDEKICKGCFEKLGGQDYVEAYEELNGKT
jgi:hypothetical protein